MMKRKRNRKGEAAPEAVQPAATPGVVGVEPVAIDPHDPLMAYLLSAGGPVELNGLPLEGSEALAQLRQAGVELLVPISHGGLMGVLQLGKRRSDQPYSSDDQRLLSSLAGQAAPALRVAELLREQEGLAKERERIANEMRVAAVIQQTLLPHDLPVVPGWVIDAYYRPAREIGGDFYDFIPLGDGRLGVVIGDVTDKGVPAALVMATTRTMIRAAANRLEDPGAVLARVNEILVNDIPPNMFVTCLYAILDPATGSFRLANAGHNLPYVHTVDGVIELRATGMPLGLMPGMTYEETEIILDVGHTVLLSSDGLVEAHDSSGEMFGFPRTAEFMAERGDGEHLPAVLVGELDRFTGPGWTQEDDITLVVVRHTSSAAASAASFAESNGWKSLTSLRIPSETGNERLAMQAVAEAVGYLGFGGEPLERLKTAVAEATMNAIEHGNRNRPELTVDVEVLASDRAVMVRIQDQGGQAMPQGEVPDLEAKLKGLQNPRGWGMFLIEKMVDELNVMTTESHHVVELIMNRKGDSNGS